MDPSSRAIVIRGASSPPNSKGGIALVRGQLSRPRLGEGKGGTFEMAARFPRKEGGGEGGGGVPAYRLDRSRPGTANACPITVEL